MTLRVLLFGRAREIAGGGEHVLHVEEGATVDRAAELLARDFPALAPLLARCSVALDEAYVGRGQTVAGTRELAVIPPIGGG